MKHYEQTFATYVYNHCNISNVLKKGSRCRRGAQTARAAERRGSVAQGAAAGGRGQRGPSMPEGAAHWGHQRRRPHLATGCRRHGRVGRQNQEESCGQEDRKRREGKRRLRALW